MEETDRHIRAKAEVALLHALALASDALQQLLTSARQGATEGSSVDAALHDLEQHLQVIRCRVWKDLQDTRTHGGAAGASGSISTAAPGSTEAGGGAVQQGGSINPSVTGDGGGAPSGDAGTGPSAGDEGGGGNNHGGSAAGAGGDAEGARGEGLGAGCRSSDMPAQAGAAQQEVLEGSMPQVVQPHAGGATSSIVTAAKYFAQ